MADEQPGGFSSFTDKLKMKRLRAKFKDTSLHKVEVEATHLRNKLGKFGNLVNKNHRHDEKHEQETDRKRTAIAESHRYNSFAPERAGNNIKWYVDGRDYFWALSVAMERAKETIYIEDWWLSPELFLRRPPYFNQEWRVDQVIKRAAERGVQVYVIVYKEVSQALTCNSAHTKHALNALCPEGQPGHGNIHVLRHPDHNVFENAGDMTQFWAHHEKFVVIDYALAFIGGLDICYGRWDVRQHLLADVHPSGVQNEVFPGQDFNNNRIMDFQTVEDWANNELNKVDYGRMPWHDVAMAVVGDCVYDIAEHFVLRWNFVKRDKYKRAAGVDWLCLEGRLGEDEDLVGVQRPKYPVGEYVQHPLSPLSTKPMGKQGTVHAQVVRSSDDWSIGILLERSIQTAYCEVIEKAEHYVYIENQFFITATGEHQAPIQNTIGRSIVNAVVRAAKEGRKFRVILVIPAIPGFAGDLRDDAAIGTRAIMDYQYKSINRGENSIMGQIAKAGIDPHQYIFVFNLRAYDRINKTPGLVQQEKESGVTYQELQRAEAEEIMGTGIHGQAGERGDKEAQHPGKGVSHDEQERIIDRKRQFESKRKHLTKDPVTSSDSIAEDAMARGGLVSEEYWEGEDPEAEKENFVQEELYIHAKLLIADDKVVICGSSNINDRSQLGNHDSELSIVMEDTKILESTMDGKPYQAGYHAATLRRHLWREHLGIIEAQGLDASKDPNAQPPNECGNDIGEGEEWEFVADPLGDKVWAMWTGQATKNTELYRMIFRADPDDNIKTWEDYDTFSPRKTVKQGHIHDPYVPVKELRAKLDQIRGHLVWMPLDFLKDENMAENMEHTVSCFPPVLAPRSEADLSQIKSRLGGALQVNSYTEVSLCTSDVALTCLSDVIFPCRVSTRRLSIGASKQVASSCPTMQWTTVSAAFQSRVQEWGSRPEFYDTTASHSYHFAGIGIIHYS
jgi:phospholipase D1/2